MLGVAAKTVVAEMVDLFLARDVAVEVEVHYKRYSHCLSIEGHPAITTLSAFTRGRALPDVAGGWPPISHESVIDYHDPFTNALDDAITAIIQLIRVDVQIVHWGRYSISKSKASSGV